MKAFVKKLEKEVKNFMTTYVAPKYTQLAENHQAHELLNYLHLSEGQLQVQEQEINAFNRRFANGLNYDTLTLSALVGYCHSLNVALKQQEKR